MSRLRLTSLGGWNRRSLLAMLQTYPRWWIYHRWGMNMRYRINIDVNSSRQVMGTSLIHMNRFWRSSIRSKWGSWRRCLRLRRYQRNPFSVIDNVSTRRWGGRRMKSMLRGVTCRRSSSCSGRPSSRRNVIRGSWRGWSSTITPSSPMYLYCNPYKNNEDDNMSLR